MFPNEVMMKPETWNDILGGDDRRPRRPRLVGVIRHDRLPRLQAQGSRPLSRQLAVRREVRRGTAEANEWIGRESVNVLNVETIGSLDAAFEARSIRVWYRTPFVKAYQEPEV